ncbi:MAG: lipoyl(octanoyl) transferase LipB [Phycisphaerales bacterium]|nr:lipoyl(octanoyl) transferase LipB [Phycisphaerales bacterium]
MAMEGIESDAAAAPAASREPWSLIVRDLGRMPYMEALAIQRDLHEAVVGSRQWGAVSPQPSAVSGQKSDISGQRSEPNTENRERTTNNRQPPPALSTQHAALSTPQPPRAMHLLLVEHDPPVITDSARKTARQPLVATPASRARAGVEVCETDRGGDITYHGPGQLVVYPILDLNTLGLRLHGYMRLLEQVVIDTLARFGIEGHRDDTATGVWVATAEHRAARNAKICAMGVRVSRWVTMHGLALNVTTNLDHFNLIIPCGLVGRGVTSMARELGEQCPSMDEVKEALASCFSARVAETGRTG